MIKYYTLVYIVGRVSAFRFNLILAQQGTGNNYKANEILMILQYT